MKQLGNLHSSLRCTDSAPPFFSEKDMKKQTPARSLAQGFPPNTQWR